MKVRELIQHWEEHAAGPLTAREYCLKLPVEDAARVAALAELYPRRHVEDILTDLLNAALDEIEQAFTYVQGSRVISEDERGDPIYEDAGLAPRFRGLTERIAKELTEEAEASAS